MLPRALQNKASLNAFSSSLGLSTLFLWVSVFMEDTSADLLGLVGKPLALTCQSTRWALKRRGLKLCPNSLFYGSLRERNALASPVKDQGLQQLPVSPSLRLFYGNDLPAHSCRTCPRRGVSLCVSLATFLSSLSCPTSLGTGTRPFMPTAPEEGLLPCIVWGPVGELSAIKVLVLLVHLNTILHGLSRPSQPHRASLGQLASVRPLQGLGG